MQRQPDGVTVRFVVTDTAQSVPVLYTGILPDLFKEGKGVVAQGKLGADGVFRASEVLAKHDENYMPPEAAEAVERAHKAMQESQKTLVQYQVRREAMRSARGTRREASRPAACCSFTRTRALLGAP